MEDVIFHYIHAKTSPLILESGPEGQQIKLPRCSSQVIISVWYDSTARLLADGVPREQTFRLARSQSGSATRISGINRRLRPCRAGRPSLLSSPGDTTEWLREGPNLLTTSLMILNRLRKG